MPGIHKFRSSQINFSSKMYAVLCKIVLIAVIFGPDLPLLYCTEFGQLILRKIIKIVATKCQILRLQCTKLKIRLRLGLRPRPRWPRGSLQRSPRPHSWIKGDLLLREGKGGRGKGGRGEEWGKGGRGRVKGGEGKGKRIWHTQLLGRSAATRTR